MIFELKKLSINDGMDNYDLLQNLPKDENGFMNGMNGCSYDEYKDWLRKSDDSSKGIGLEDWMVPQTIYWLYADGKPVGMGKLRHYLTDNLKIEGGHCGYGIAPSHRKKGYGKTLLKLLIGEAKDMGIDRILVTINNENTASINTALGNGGVIEKINDLRHYIWIDCIDYCFTE